MNRGPRGDIERCAYCIRPTAVYVNHADTPGEYLCGVHGNGYL